MMAFEENNNRQLEVEILGLTRDKNEAMEATRRIEVKANQSLHQAKLQQKEMHGSLVPEPLALHLSYGSIWL